MKLHFLYKVTNIRSGRYYIGSVVSADATWLCVPTLLPGVTHRENFQFNPGLLADIRNLGMHNFLVEGLHASALSEDIERMKSRLLTPDVLRSEMTYNKVHTTQNPDDTAERSRRMKELNAARAKSKAK